MERLEAGFLSLWTKLTIRHWKMTVFAIWLIACLLFVQERWGAIHAFALADTDDNLRLLQVRDWLAGQGWFDLSQHRLDIAHGGANIHWSRIADLPIAGLILLLRPFLGAHGAEMWAAALAPLLPLGVVMAAIAVITRRLVDPKAMPLALFTFLVFAGFTIGMFKPLRIDHHGWQLAMLAWTVAGMADPRRRRGGVVAGIASAISLTIGMEMVIYLALAAAGIVIGWIIDREQRDRMVAFAAAIGAGTSIGFLFFASEANRTMVCDALSPVWLSDAMLGAALLLAIAFVPARSWTIRLALAAGAGVVLAAFHGLSYPQCLSRLEGVSDEAVDLWLGNVKEARPLLSSSKQMIVVVLGLPIAALLGHIWLAVRAKGDADRLRIVLTVAAMSLAATLLIFWQLRAGPAAQLLAVPGAIALAWLGHDVARRLASPLLRALALAFFLLFGLGALPLLVAEYAVPAKAEAKNAKAVAKANRDCGKYSSFDELRALPRGTIFTYVDFGPRLLVTTDHDAIAGPYHRNYEAIVAIMKAFRSDEAEARTIIVDDYASDYVLICPNQSSATVFAANAPDGFHQMLATGKAPGWLDPVELSDDSPWMLWTVKR